ncbi:hypothetical protein RhiirA5_435319 [Rhizophagus irregularis]|uniref:Uncharacterized protein n=1 Tax=Rhizophagus irregularis TaxID=588596 RepID=A0A2N0NNN4_9GLOM|nr:hypothetical protein RhiirA5_435319 [Rhizophagus irregularis]
MTRLFLDNWMRRTSNVELARIPYNDGRRHGPYESHHLLRHQGIKKTIGYASTLAVVLIKIHVGRKLNAGDTKGVSLEFGKWVYGGGKKLPGFVRRRNAKRDLSSISEIKDFSDRKREDLNTLSDLVGFTTKS